MSFPKKGKAKVLFFAMILLIGFALFGCSDDKSTSVTNPNPNTLNPTGTVQGLLKDSVTNQPIVGAVVDIDGITATTNGNGQYSLKNVPATTDALNGTVTGSYSVTIDMKNVTSPVNMKDAATTPRYPDYSYSCVEVSYTSLDDTEGGNDEGGSGSNHDTPVTGLSATMNVTVGKLAAAINGIVAYDTTLQPVGSDWTVRLISLCSANTGTGACENVVGTTTTDADSKFSFSNIESLQSFRIEALNSDETYYGARDEQAPADGQTKTLTIQQGNALFASLTDDVNPTITSVTPENLADITPAATDVVFTFSEPIRQSAYTNTSPSAPGGMYYDVDVNWDGMKTGNIAHSISWNTDYTQLTVNIPTLSPSSIYSVDLCDANLTDDALHGVTNLCDTGKGVISFSTTGAASASAPTIAIVNPSAIDNVFPANIVSLDWTAVTGAKKYNVYQADNQVWGGTTTPGAFRIVAQGVGTSSYTTTAPLSFVEGTEIKLTYSFYVTSVNSDNIESVASNTETAEDVVGPILTGAPASYRTDFSDGNDTITLLFNELLDETTAETAGNYTLSNITDAPSITSAVYAAVPPTVTLTLSDNLAVADIGKATITTGTNGINNSAVGGDDVQVILPGQGLANQVAITAGVNLVLDSVPGGDDVIVGTTITTGPDGICQTAIGGDDVQVIPVGQGLANQVAINAGPNLALDSIPAPDDVVVPAPIIITVSGVKDVAGNTIRATGDAITSSGNIQ